MSVGGLTSLEPFPKKSAKDLHRHGQGLNIHDGTMSSHIPSPSTTNPWPRFLEIGQPDSTERLKPGFGPM